MINRSRAGVWARSITILIPLFIMTPIGGNQVGRVWAEDAAPAGDEPTQAASAVAASDAPDPVSTRRPASQEQAPATARPLDWKSLIQPGDRVLFVGDDMTQQMFYTRGVASALLAVMPDAGLRFFNGGKEGSTAGQALNWVDELLLLAKPTVVFVCFGLNDAIDPDAGPDTAASFENNLGLLARKIKSSTGVRRVVLLSAPAVLSGGVSGLDAQGYNSILKKLSQRTMNVARDQGAGFIDLFDYMDFVCQAVEQAPGDPINLGRLPNEQGHIIIASVVLKGIGLGEKEMQPVGWSPLPPRKMARIRNALPIPLKAPDLDAAQRSGDLYAAIGEFDEAFFRVWRIAGKRRTAPPRDVAVGAAEDKWAAAQRLVKEYSGH